MESQNKVIRNEQDMSKNLVPKDMGNGSTQPSKTASPQEEANGLNATSKAQNTPNPLDPQERGKRLNTSSKETPPGKMQSLSNDAYAPYLCVILPLVGICTYQAKELKSATPPQIMLCTQKCKSFKSIASRVIECSNGC
jgi:hypothetical protein